MTEIQSLYLALSAPSHACTVPSDRSVTVTNKIAMTSMRETGLISKALNLYNWILLVSTVAKR